MKRLILSMILLLSGVAWAQPIPAEEAVLMPQRSYPGAGLDPLVDYGYCGPPTRDENGKIIRREDVKQAFLALHPCPSTGERTGECPDWAMDHTRPLACGGCDSVSNLAWLHKSVKSAAGRPHFFPKDRIERKVYGADPPIPDTDNCTFVTPERILK
jgi:hypothetical protein